MKEGYWEVDGIGNAIDYLEMISHFLTQVDSDWKWKWVIIATHQALYSFGLCALAGTSAWHTVTDRGEDGKKRNEGQMVAQARALDTEGDTSEIIAQKLGVDEDKAVRLLKQRPKIIGIDQVLKRLSNKQYLLRSNSVPLQLKPEESQAVDALVKTFRNEFEHFHPGKYWFINTDKVATTINSCIPVIEFIALKSNCIRYNQEEPQRIQLAFEQIKKSLDQYLSIA